MTTRSDQAPKCGPVPARERRWAVASAARRERGIEDYGTRIAGDDRVLDRIDPFTFATPISFHLTRYLFT
jgi:predicted CDP-diglyceride synthetase/phosphatidate cytidylyltransferase